MNSTRVRVLTGVTEVLGVVKFGEVSRGVKPLDRHTRKGGEFFLAFGGFSQRGLEGLVLPTLFPARWLAMGKSAFSLGARFVSFTHSDA